MIELDKRIISGKKPLTCFDTEQAQNFVGKKCYLTNDISLFSDLNAFKDIKGCNEAIYEGVADTLTNINTEVSLVFETTYLRWKFCIPCEWVKEEKTEPEPKYRVLTLNEFLERFKIGDAIYIRFKKDGAERVVIFSEYNIPPHKDEGNNTESVCLNGIEHHLKSIVCLGMREYNLTTLFDCYEYFDGKDWQPFGVIDESQE